MNLNLEQARSLPAQQHTSTAPRYPVTPWSAQRLYRPFVRASVIIALTLGFTTGAGMLLADSFGVDRGIWWVTHAQAHGMAQIYGYAGLFTIGVAFHVVPRFRNGPVRFPMPQRITLWLFILAIAFRFTGQSISDYPTNGILLIISGVLLLAGAALLATTLYAVLAGGRNPRGPAERWIFAGTTWMLISAVVHLVLTVWLLSNKTSIAPYHLNSAVIYSSLLGFVSSFIMGVSTRGVKGFLGLRTAYGRLEKSSFAVFHSGLVIAISGLVLDAPSEITAAGLLLLSIGAAGFAISLRIFEPSEMTRAPISPGAYRRFSWFLRSAYVWLVIGAGLLAADSVQSLFDFQVLPDGNAAPIVHVFTVGFATSMIIGMGVRMIPLFEGAIVRGQRALDAGFVLLPLSVITRTAGGFTSDSYASTLLGISGVAGLMAVVFSTPAILGAMRQSSRDRYRKMASEHGRVRWQESAETNAPHR